MNRLLKTISLLLVGLLSTGTMKAETTTPNTCTVTGHVQFLNPTFFQKYNWVWLRKGLGRNLTTVDSVRIGSDGNFQFTLKDKPGLYQLDVLKWQTVPFWSDADVTMVCRGYDTARVKAKNSGFVALESQSAANRLLNIALYGKMLDKQLLDEVLAESLRARQEIAKDSTWYGYVREHDLYGRIAAQSDARLQELVRNHPGNPADVYLLSLLDSPFSSEFLTTTLAHWPAESPGFEESQMLRQQLLIEQRQAKTALTGGNLPAFNFPTPSGKTLTLSNLKGRYFLIDFWASWCGPCRKSIPKLKELYTLYHAKGLEILSISIDTDQTAWRSAMKDEAMPWPQALSPDKDKTLKDFNIQGVPTLFLVNKDGKIVEKFTGYQAKLDVLLKDLLY